VCAENKSVSEIVHRATVSAIPLSGFQFDLEQLFDFEPETR
jgi:hypothetical protein